ncbi:MAG: hypothetical protein AAED33_01745 [Paracoccaceae bacterium]|jgi:predicted neutral ceramidase superfamily lipid hydrolase
MKLETDKPRQNTLLIILTMFDLIAAAAGAMPFAMSALITSGADALGQSNYPIIISVPIAAVVLILVAWTMEAASRPKAAGLIAAIPLVWGMTVLVMLNDPSV